MSLDRNAVISDEGVFASSRRSISANPKFSTSVFLQGDDVTHKQQFGERKRRMSLGDHMRSSSEFWEMRRSVDNPMLFPVAVGNSHPSFSNSLDHSMALRGVIQLKSTPHSRSSRTLSRTGLGSDVDDLRSQSQTTVSGDHRRSHSAPPSSRSLAHYHTPMTTTPPKYFKEERGGNSRPSSKVISPISPQPRTEVNRVNTASMGEKISKWSTPTLGDYFKEKEHGKNVQRPRSDSRESTVSPASYHSSSTNSIGTADRYGRGPTKFFNTADQARGSLRKQVGQSHSIAPYGTDR